MPLEDMWVLNSPDFIRFGAVVLLCSIVYWISKLFVWLFVSRYPLNVKSSILSGELLSAYRLINKQLNPRYCVQVKVRLSDVASVKAGVGKMRRRAVYDEARTRVFDFVVCKKDDLKPVLAFKLGGSIAGMKSIVKAANSAGIDVYACSSFKVSKHQAEISSVLKKKGVA